MINIEKAKSDLEEKVLKTFNESRIYEEPFIQRLLNANKENKSKAEQELFEFIISNWLWSLPVYEDIRDNQIIGYRKLVGYRITNREETLERCIYQNYI